MFYLSLSFPRGCLDAAALLRLWAAAYMKWPPAIDAWQRGHAHLGGPGVSAGPCGGDSVSAAPRADDWSSIGMEVVQSLSGKTLGAMHEAISAGRMASTMGAQIFFQRLGQLEPIGNSNKRKRTAETHVVLGKLQEKFRVVHIPDVWSELFRVARTLTPSGRRKTWSSSGTPYRI